MTRFSLFLAISALAFLCGCSSPDPAPAEPPALGKGETILREARQLEKSGDLKTAYIRYSEAMDHAGDLAVMRHIGLERAALLLKMKRCNAALAALEPMPEFPDNLYDCRKMMLAAKILQHMNIKGEYIEALMEVALDNHIDEPGVIPFKAAGYTELGKVYVANRKTRRAVKCFDFAAELYRKNNEPEKAQTCANIRDYLK